MARSDANLPIPPVLHQIWWQGEAHVPPRYEALRASFRRNNPLWRCVLWSEKEIVDLIRSSYPALERIVTRECQKIVEKVDVAKFVILHQHGGVYCDMDMECLQSLDMLLEGSSLIAASLFICPGSLRFVVNNAFIAAVPAHPAVRAMLHHIETVAITCAMVDVVRINARAGPLAWTQVLQEFCSGDVWTTQSFSRRGVRVLLPGTVDLLCPPELDCLAPWCPEPFDRLVVHHAEGSWRSAFVVCASTAMFCLISTLRRLCCCCCATRLPSEQLRWADVFASMNVCTRW